MATKSTKKVVVAPAEEKKETKTAATKATTAKKETAAKKTTATKTTAAKTTAAKKTTATKTAAKKTTTAAKKTTATKAAAKKTTATKTTAAKKTAAKKESNVFVEFGGNQANVEAIKKNAIADYKAKSGKKSATSVNIYIKPEDRKAYYVIDDVHGDVAL